MAKMFQYKVRYVDDEDLQTYNSRGLIAADSYADATEQVYEYFTAPDDRNSALDGIVSICVAEVENIIEKQDLSNEGDLW